MNSKHWVDEAHTCMHTRGKGCGQSLVSARLRVSEVRHKLKLAAIDYDDALEQDRDEKVQVVLGLHQC